MNVMDCFMENFEGVFELMVFNLKNFGKRN